MESESARVIAIITLGMLLTYVSIFGSKPLEDWRGATKYINSINISNKGNTLVWPGLMEQRDWGWSKKSENQKYLLAPFSFYHLRKKAILLPLIPDKLKLEDLLSEHDISIKNLKNEIYLILRNTYVKERKMPKAITGQNIFENWLRRNGFSIIQKKTFGGVVVSRFSFRPDTRIH